MRLTEGTWAVTGHIYGSANQNQRPWICIPSQPTAFFGESMECLLVSGGRTAPCLLSICRSLWDMPRIRQARQYKVPVAVVKFLYQPPTVGKPYLDVCGRLWLVDCDGRASFGFIFCLLGWRTGIQHLGGSAEERELCQEMKRNKAPSRRGILSQIFTEPLLHLALYLVQLIQGMTKTECLPSCNSQVQQNSSQTLSYCQLPHF